MSLRIECLICSNISFFSQYAPELNISCILKEPVSFSHTSIKLSLILCQSKIIDLFLTASKYELRSSLGYVVESSGMGQLPWTSFPNPRNWFANSLSGRYFLRFSSFMYKGWRFNGFRSRSVTFSLSINSEILKLELFSSNIDSLSSSNCLLSSS